MITLASLSCFTFDQRDDLGAAELGLARVCRGTRSSLDLFKQDLVGINWSK